jgi:hypothetical protein
LAGKNTSARDKFAPKTNLAVSSTEFCRCKFDEGNFREGLGGSGGHIFMMPLSSLNQSKIVIADLADALLILQLSKVEHGVMIDSEYYQRAGLET